MLGKLIGTVLADDDLVSVIRYFPNPNTQRNAPFEITNCGRLVLLAEFGDVAGQLSLQEFLGIGTGYIKDDEICHGGSLFIC